MMRLLTGASSSSDKPFVFLPLTFAAICSTVLVEGIDRNRSVLWVHAWTVTRDGIITQVREYFNTSLTVTRIIDNSNQSSPTSSSTSPSSSSSSPAVASFKCQQLWQSKLSKAIGKDVPGLVLAI
ncbi:wound-induced protein 1-like [Macadamia integrifolia]|uniref:wound-induced protein 1-like n=1 Tax=Macadamia integrifolia TaxID=60698 RepID=UPI001C5327BB|nr:wound-induced protein 1-like [Macadamia integrifolia]